MKGVLGSVKCRAEARRGPEPGVFAGSIRRPACRAWGARGLSEGRVDRASGRLLWLPFWWNLLEARMPRERQPGFRECVTSKSQRAWVVRLLPQKGTLGPRPREVGGGTRNTGGT